MCWSKIYEETVNSVKYRVLQHPYLQTFNIETWGDCDNPASYSRHYGWYCLKQVNGIHKVNEYFKNNIWCK